MIEKLCPLAQTCLDIVLIEIPDAVVLVVYERSRTTKTHALQMREPDMMTYWYDFDDGRWIRWDLRPMGDPIIPCSCLPGGS